MANREYDEWDEPSNEWDDSNQPEKNNSGKKLNLKFKLNSKSISIFAGLIVFIIVLAISSSVFLKNDSPKVKPSPTASSSSMSNTIAVDLYSQPKLLQLFIDNALASSVTIFCGNYSGSGWSIDLSDDYSSTKDDSYPTEILTNQHVIDGCETGGLTIIPMGTNEKYDAYVYSYDRSNDLAILMTSKYLTPLATVQPDNEAKVGQWVMAIGSPGAGNTTLDGSVTTGTITNLKDDYVITDTTINPGNSGGPLLNAAGQVVAVVSAKVVDTGVENIGIARNVSLVCRQLNGCSTKRLLK